MRIISIVLEWVNFMIIMGRPKQFRNKMTAIIVEKYGFSAEFIKSIKRSIEELSN